jgi:DNA N-6-adenine-methyltransferase (Dam)
MSSNFEWYTPKKYIELARTCMGSIDLDPASCDKAQKTVKAGTFYTLETDGLCQPWFGNVFLNPPYSKHLITRIIDKLFEELPHINQVIVLTDARTDTPWFRRLRENLTTCFTHGRIYFIDEGGEPGTPKIGSAFFYFGHNPKRFAKLFSEAGSIIKPVQTSNSITLSGHVKKPPHRPAGSVRYSPYQLEQVQRLRKAGLSIREIADHVALTKSTVWNILNS